MFNLLNILESKNRQRTSLGL